MGENAGLHLFSEKIQKYLSILVMISFKEILTLMLSCYLQDNQSH